MAKSCKCDPHEICEECPEWIFTLADLIMCMMGLFVLLWVLKPTPSKEINPDSNWIKVAAAIRDAFGYLPDPDSKDPVDIQMLLKKLEKMKVPHGPGEGGETKVRREGAEGTDPEVTTVRKGPQAVTGGHLTFNPGQATLLPETAHDLQQLVDQIIGHRNIVMVKGHTSLDDFADEATPQVKMDLSLRRAQAAADYFVAHGVSPDILRVQGCSTFEPVVQRRYTPEDQLQNRRVEVEVTTNLVPELQDRSSTAPALQ